MNQEIPISEREFIPPADTKRGDLSAEQKEQLAQVWSGSVVDNINIPGNIRDMSPDEIKKWLFESIMVDIERLANEWGLQVDVELAKKIQTAEDMDEKTALEMEYIQKSHSQVDALTQKFDKSKSSKWDSWPKRMRETNQFNCVGATLLGIYFLEKGGIKSYYGNPHGHVLNIVELPNGEWWYVDFLNGEQNIIKIEPEEAMIEGVRVLKINNPQIGYQLIPIYKNKEAAGSMLGNLQALQEEAGDETISDQNIGKQEAKEILQKHGKNIEKVNFLLLHESLYPKFDELNDSEEMKNEIARLDPIQDCEKPAQDYIKTLAKDEEKELVAEIRAKKEEIIRLFYSEGKDAAIPQEVGPKLKKLLGLFLESLRSIKDKNPEAYQDAVERIVIRIKHS